MAGKSPKADRGGGGELLIDGTRIDNIRWAMRRLGEELFWFSGFDVIEMAVS